MALTIQQRNTRSVLYEKDNKSWLKQVDVGCLQHKFQDDCSKRKWDNTMDADRQENAQAGQTIDPSMKIKIVENGPYLVSGNIPLDEEVITPVGHHKEYRQSKTYDHPENYALCRCGQSKNPPFCDGAHVDALFDGTETASRAPFDERARVFRGPELDLQDDNRCAYARFCHQEDGDVWNLTEESDDPKLRKEAIQASSDCPAGRLVHREKDGTSLEPELKPGISVLQDPEEGVSAGIYVRGGIPLESADGTLYELRNRYALCRCGHSKNKPFCDARHVNVRYKVD